MDVIEIQEKHSLGEVAEMSERMGMLDWNEWKLYRSGGGRWRNIAVKENDRRNSGR